MTPVNARMFDRLNLLHDAVRNYQRGQSPKWNKGLPGLFFCVKGVYLVHPENSPIGILERVIGLGV